MTKACCKCFETKPLESFSREAGNKSDGRRGSCKTCDAIRCDKYRRANKPKMAAYSKAYRKKHPEISVRHHLKRHYGITLEQRDALLASQDFKCAICTKGPTQKRPLAVDHDHSTGVVRGILCYGCNRAIAVLDNHKLLAKVAKYLGHHID